MTRAKNRARSHLDEGANRATIYTQLEQRPGLINAQVCTLFAEGDINSTLKKLDGLIQSKKAAAQKKRS